MTAHITARSAVAAALVVVGPLTGCATDTSTSTEPQRSSSPRSGSGTGGYQDGTYTVRGVYGGAPSYMTITLTLTANTISNVTVEPMPDNNDTSRGYQERFAAAVPDEVIGKSIDDLQIGKLAGASGCADGFNDALTKIRAQARANR